MSKINNGGPAFPSLPQQMQIDEATGKLSPVGFEGMSLRDWYAGQALPEILRRAYEISDRDGPMENLYVAASIAAHEVADAMLAAREQKP